MNEIADVDWIFDRAKELLLAEVRKEAARHFRTKLGLHSRSKGFGIYLTFTPSDSARTLRATRVSEVFVASNEEAVRDREGVARRVVLAICARLERDRQKAPQARTPDLLLVTPRSDKDDL